MKLETIDWANAGLRQSTTSSGCFVGVAIGPESDVGRVRINGVLVQAGRPLVLASPTYTVERILKPTDGSSTFPFTASMKSLQLMLFESLAEMAAAGDLARPDRGYSDSEVAEGVKRLRVPFQSRRMLQVDVEYGGGVPTYGLTITGRKWKTAAGGFVAGRVLVNLSAAQCIALAAQMSDAGGESATKGITVYIGGEDNAERWDEITVKHDTNAYCDATVIGELGTP